MDKGMDFYNKEINEILSIFNSNEKGLTSFQSQANISKYGKNTLKNDKKISFFARFLAQFKNIMIIILLISSAV
ncbi:MAG: cation-transporting P-type ATPase, partial [Clostridia bacterium]